MVDSLSDMMLRGQAIQVHLEPLDRLESLVVEVQEWKESAATTFLQKDSPHDLLEVKSQIQNKSKATEFCRFSLPTLPSSLVQQLFCSLQVLCPRCDVGNVGSPKRKAKKVKESPKSSKKKTLRLSTLSDVEKALSETKDSTSAVSTGCVKVSIYTWAKIFWLSHCRCPTAQVFYCSMFIVALL